MNLTNKKIFFFILFVFFSFPLLSPKLVFGQLFCQCGNNRIDTKKECEDSGNPWVCGCPYILEDGTTYVQKVDTAFCRNVKGKDMLKKCYDDGAWHEEECLYKCKNSNECNPKPLPTPEKCSRSNCFHCINFTSCETIGCYWDGTACYPPNSNNIPPSSSNNKIDLSAPSNFKSLQNLTFKSSIPAIINIIYIISSLTFFFILLSGGLKWLTSGGDEKKVAAARSQITNGFIGLAIVFSVWALTNLIGQLFGFEIEKITIFKSFHQPTPTPPPK